MVNPSTARLGNLLTSLGERARSAKKPDLTPALGLVNDVSRLIIRGGEADVRTTQSAVAALRERLDGEAVKESPAKSLESVNSHTYLAGAMWALNEVMSARLATIEAQDVDSHPVSRKNQVSRMVCMALLEGQPVSATSLLDLVCDDGTPVRRDELSRAIGALVDKGWAEVAPAPSGVDGRKKFFVLTAVGQSAIEEEIGLVH
jgi:hypothetical protein